MIIIVIYVEKHVILDFGSDSFNDWIEFANISNENFIVQVNDFISELFDSSMELFFRSENFIETLKSAPIPQKYSK